MSTRALRAGTQHTESDGLLTGSVRDTRWCWCGVDLIPAFASIGTIAVALSSVP
ncbi:hypothetical protein [Streptomyces sp. DH10]|uniref:hypothetical protein n=1 Tax=Streptomyces sp. DH10 TaxID=3040121 RepID=UPI002442465A|nr:hypothetical protein [Streptomyces sp. DH10]MDG9711203.1 hypothetical protein [Streptomyces sp. DH10]